MAIASARPSVATTVTLLSIGTEADNKAGRTTLVYNPTGGASVILGGNNVTATTGLELPSGGSVAIDLAAGELLYGIVASGTQVVHVLQGGL